MNSTGHMVLFQAAYDMMTPQARQWVSRVLSDPNNPEDGGFSEPSDTTVPGAATEPDDYKSWARKTHNGDDPKSYDHFYNQPVGDAQYTAGHAPDAQNGVTQFNKQLGLLENPPDSDTQADALRWIIHEYGDIGAQPLHCAVLYSAQFPNGDEGGNKFNITWGSTDKYDTDLHGLLDEGGAHPDPNDPSVADDNFKYLKGGLTPSNKAWIENKAQSILQANPESAFTSAQLNDEQPMDWVHDLSSQAAQIYQQFTPGESVSPDDPRLANLEQTMDRNVALSAYRLANLCDSLAAQGGSN
ncbi:MAG: S1/P1 nuclease [Candidatus Xenobia bacterium]